jgi:hypothetical protein
LAGASPQDLPDEARLTQYGGQAPVGSGFRDRLRPEIGETEMSMILGEVDATAAAILIAKAVNTQPMIGNLAWAPSPAFEEVEVLDRLNGVPTLGVFGKPGERILFWRALGYVPADDISAWVYVPLSPADEKHLSSADPSELLHGLIFESDEWRRVTVGVASGYRLFIDSTGTFRSRCRPGISSTRCWPFSCRR